MTVEESKNFVFLRLCFFIISLTSFCVTDKYTEASLVLLKKKKVSGKYEKSNETREKRESTSVARIRRDFSFTLIIIPT